MDLIRLNKFIKDMGICSRRKADEFIEKGYILVNDKVITELGYKVNPDHDHITILPELELEKSQFHYILLNKPKGYICSNSSYDGKNIFELLPKIKGLSYAGRLDKESCGLIILSNDGKFTYSVFGEEFAYEKEYVVRVNKSLTPSYLFRQSNGSIVVDGILVKPAKVRLIDDFTYSIILTQGINRQIRKMAESLHYQVTDLQRIRIGGISDNNLALGKWRNLTKAEIILIQGK